MDESWTFTERSAQAEIVQATFEAEARNLEFEGRGVDIAPRTFEAGDDLVAANFARLAQARAFFDQGIKRGSAKCPPPPLPRAG